MTYHLTAPFARRSPHRGAAALQQWYGLARVWLRVNVRLHGRPADVPTIYVANHRSYLDIIVLGELLRAAFLSRADVAAWPLVGYVARRVGTLFVDRDEPWAGARAALALRRCARTGSVVVFPEATTRGERLPGTFRTGLFGLLHHLETPIVPVTIRYSDRRVYWTDDVSLGRHLRTRVLSGPPITAAVHIGEAIYARDFADATGLGNAVREAICQPIERFGELT